MDINEALLNFHSALNNLWGNLKEAEISPGDDEWDEITELLYANLVNMSVGIKTGHYAFYSAEQEKQNLIQLVIPDGQEVMVGTEAISKNGITKTIKWKNTIYSNNIKFEFREYSHPSEFASKTSLNYIIGQAPEHQLQICAPYKDVSYKIISPNKTE